MIKLVDEHITNPSQSIEQSRNRRQPINKSNLGLRNLKQTEDYIDQVKRRLSLLEIQQQKNKHKMRENYRKLKYLSKIQDQTAKDEMRKMKHQQKVKEQRQILKINKNLQKQKQRQNLKYVREDLLQANRKVYDKIREDRDTNEGNIKQTKSKQKDKKIEKRKKVNEMEKKQREYVKNFHEKKKNTFLKNSELEGMYYETRRSERSVLLQELSSLEMQMIRKQSTSKSALDESAQLLNMLKGRGKALSSKSHKQKQRSVQDDPEKLPSLSGQELRKHLDFVVF